MQLGKVFFVIGAAFIATAVWARPTLVPYPQKVVEKEGACLLATNFIVEADVKWQKDAAIPAEGYKLSVTPSGATVWSSGDAGAFYAFQTLKQLARPQNVDVRVKPLEIPCVEIEDAPKFKWRGFMLDEARHFMGKETVKKYIDLMSRVKMNVFHWHLTDDEGWRLEIKCHPEVHEKGSVRPEQMNHGATEGNPSWNNEQYGPYYYTHEDVKEILDYAAKHFVKVVPEIDIPAHSRALFVSHPEFTCIGPNETFKYPWMKIGPQYECFCAANEDGMTFIEDILDEVCRLFPSQQIHIGGDECPPNRWQECPKCQALMKKLGYKDARMLQTRMTRRFAKFLGERGREVIAWDEVLSKDMPQNLVMQLWRDPKDGRKAAEAGLDVIMSPSDWTYFTRPQNIDDDAIQYLSGEGWAVTLEKAFRFDPLVGMTPETAARVRGIECCGWAEMTWGWFDLNWKMWPRSFANAEVAWCGPNTTDFQDFLARMAPLRKRLCKEHINAAPITVHPGKRMVAAEGYEQPVSWKANSINGLGFMSAIGMKMWKFYTDNLAKDPPDWAMLKNLWFEHSCELKLEDYRSSGDKYYVKPNTSKYKGLYPVKIEEVWRANARGDEILKTIDDFEKRRPMNPLAFCFWGSRPGYILNGNYDMDVADFNLWKKKHPAFYAFGAYDEFDSDKGGFLWQFYSMTNMAEKARIAKNFPPYDDIHLKSGAGWTYTLKRFEEAFHWGCRDLFGLYSVGLTSGHDLGQVGCKYLWYEAELGSTSSPWRWGGMFVRGAGRQFSMNWGWYTANYYQHFTRDGQAKDGFMHWPGPTNPSHKPYEGCSRSLTHRNNFYGYLIGASANSIEGGSCSILTINKEDPKKPALSDIGKDYNSIFEFDQHHDRGATYSPVAFMTSIDQPVNRQFFYPKEHGVTDKFSSAAFLMTLVPTYEKSTAMFSDRKGGDQGCLFNSPFGEIADMLCPDVDQDGNKFLAALSGYKAAFLIGEYNPKHLKSRALAEYVRQGGTLFVSADQVKDGYISAELAGVTFSGEKKPCYETVISPEGRTVFMIYPVDGKYLLYTGAPTTAKPYLRDGRLNPAVWVNDFGKGNVYVVGCRRMMPDEYEDTNNYFERLEPMSSGYRTFPFIKYLLERVQDDLMPIAVTGDIQWGLNKTGKGWLLWMINNRGCKKFYGEAEEIDPKCVSRVAVNLKALKGMKVTELTPTGTAGEIAAEDGIFSVDVAPCTIRTVAIE